MSTNHNRKRKTKFPCPECQLHLERCICDQIPCLSLKTKLTLVIHYKELKRTTNTGSLALKALTNSVQIVRGEINSNVDSRPVVDSHYENLLFFPSKDAIDLSQTTLSQFTKPINLVVPDGNWRQASKVGSRLKELKLLPRVMLSTPNLAREHLRAESTEYGMSTLEAIARAYGIIEGAQVERSLLNLYEAKLRATLKGRGTIK